MVFTLGQVRNLALALGTNKGTPAFWTNKGTLALGTNKVTLIATAAHAYV